MKILNFGSLNIDFVYKVDHFTRAGETVAGESFEKFCGGKGLNQSVALARAGANVYHAGCIGEDGDMLLKLLSQSGANTAHVRKLDKPSGHAIIQIDKAGQNSILLYGGANHAIDTQHIDDTLSHFGEGDTLLIQNEINNLAYIMEKVHGKGMKIAMNPSPISKSMFDLPLELVSTFILNEIEGKEISGKSQPDEILTALRGKFPAATFVLTLGKDGVIYDDGNCHCSHHIYDVPVVDTTGAGDTFTGYFLTCIIRGDTPQESLRLASIASSIAVSRMGAAPSIPRMSDVTSANLKPLHK